MSTTKYSWLDEDTPSGKPFSPEWVEQFNWEIRAVNTELLSAGVPFRLKTKEEIQQDLQRGEAGVNDIADSERHHKAQFLATLDFWLTALNNPQGTKVEKFDTEESDAEYNSRIVNQAYEAKKNLIPASVEPRRQFSNVNHNVLIKRVN